MKIQKLNDNTLLIPKRLEENGIVGDTVIEIKSTHEDYNKYLEQYQREQKLQLKKEK